LDLAGRTGLGGVPLRGLQGIYFLDFLFARGLKVRGHAAASESPFDGGIRKSQAVIAGGSFQNLVAAFTFLNDGVAAAPIELATVVAHEGTLHSFFDGFTNHGYHILSSGILKNINPTLSLI
jgi:hypothetical protein